MALPNDPITREEMYLSNIAGEGTQLPDHPVTRVEQYLEYIANNGGGGGGTTNYEALNNKPQVNGTTLSGNKTSADLGLQDELTFDLAPTESSTNPVTSGGVYGSLETKADASELETTKTATGSIVTVEDAAPINAEDVTVQIEPVQDLHGYDHPWAGGAGVNLFSEVWNNVGDVTIRGESINVTPNTTYYGRYYDLPNDNTLQLYLAEYDNNDTLLVANLLSVGRPYATITTSANTAYIKPQINFTAGSKPTGFKTCVNVSNPTINGNYFPYANECPISGFDEVEVVNMADVTNKKYFDGLLNGTYGVVDLGTLSWEKTNTTGLFYGGETSDGATSSENYLCSKYPFYSGALQNMPDKTMRDAGGTTKIYIKDTAYSDAPSFTAAMSGVHLIYELATPTTPTITPAEFNALLEEFGINGYVVTVTLPDTIYGGTLDVTTGELVVDRASVDLGTLTWSKNTDYTNVFFFSLLSSKKYSSELMACSDYKYGKLMTGTTALNTMENLTINAGKDTNTIYIRDDNYTNATLADFTTAVAGAQLVYELATPQTYQLTPTQVKMLLGYNNIWANSGDTTLEYQPNNVVGEIKEEIEKLTDVPTEDGTYVLTATVSSGVVSYEWVEQE